MPQKARAAIDAFLQQDTELKGITGEEAGDASAPASWNELEHSTSDTTSKIKTLRTASTPP